MSGMVRRSDEQTDLIALLKDSATGFLATGHEFARLRALRETPAGFDHDMLRRMAAMGWLGLRVPEAGGGAGLGIEVAAALAEVFGKVLLPEPFILCAVMPAALLADVTEGAQRTALLSGIASGELVVAPALFERLDQIDPLPITTRLDPRGNAFVLNGTKLFVLSAVDRYLVGAQCGGETVLVAVAADATGITRSERRMTDGTMACDIAFADVAVGDDAILERGAVAEVALAGAINEGVLAASAQLCGIAAGAMDIALAYLRQREQFGRPIGSFQALQHRAVDLLLQIELAGAAWRNAARRYADDPGAEASLAAVSAAKARCSDVALLVSRASIQFHGAIGFTDEADIGFFLKAAMRFAPMLGNASRHRHRFFDLHKELAA